MAVIHPTGVPEPDQGRAPFEGDSRRPAQSYWNESWERLRANRIGVAAGVVILILALIAIAAPLFSQLLTHFDPTRQHLVDNFRPPGHPYLLGTDELGRDTLTRLIYGGRVTLGVAALTVALSLTVGTTVGLLAGYYGRWIDDILMRIVDVFLAIPAIFLFILMSILFRPNAITLAAIIASVGWGGVARLVRGEVLSVKQRDFILAARSIGARDLRLIIFHMLPNVLPVLIVAASLGVGQIILIEAALDFLGLGIQPPTASWGNMLTNAESYFFHSSWLVVFPGITIFVTVLASNIFGNAVRDAFDPRLKQTA
ncbi:MAG TPA: ABC transporter permease [Candidatus Dormibacteraeota bacterium]|jgi:peptide/nickel transport system permease protein